MNLMEYIQLLELLQKEHGNITVMRVAPYAPLGSMNDVNPPRVQDVRVPRPRESYVKVCSMPEDLPSGKKIVVI